MNKKQANLIDSLPTLGSTGSSSKSDIPTFDTTVLPAEAVSAVDNFITAGIMKNQAEAQQEQAQPFISEAATRLLDDLAENDSFCKSVKLVGTVGQVTVTRADKFSIGKDTTLAALEAELGKKFVAEHFVTENEVLLNPKVLKDNKLLKELIDLVGAANFAKFFVKVSTVAPVKGLDKDLFTLPADKREVVRNGLVKQASSSIKLS